MKTKYPYTVCFNDRNIYNFLDNSIFNYVFLFHFIIHNFILSVSDFIIISILESPDFTAINYIVSI